MAEKMIINMPEKTTPADTDLIIIEDAADTKRMTWANLVKPIKDAINTHKAETASRLDRVPFNVTPKPNVTILSSECYSINNIAYINAKIKKTDDSFFTPQDVFTVPHTIVGTVELGKIGLNGTKARNIEIAYIYSNGNVYIALNENSLDTETLHLSGMYLIS